MCPHIVPCSKGKYSITHSKFNSKVFVVNLEVGLRSMSCLDRKLWQIQSHLTDREKEKKQTRRQSQRLR